MITITGKNIMLYGENEDVGLWFINTEDESKNAVVKASELGVNKCSLITCDIPLLEPGTYRIRIVTQYTKSSVPKKDSMEFTTEELYSVKA